MYDDNNRDYGRSHGDQYYYEQQGYTRKLPSESRSSKIDGKRLWAGGAATVIVAVLVAFVGLLVARGIFAVPVFAPKNAGLFGDSTTTVLCTLAAVGALLATALMHLLLLTTPAPRTFFAVITTLVVLVFALQPLTMDYSTSTKVATVLVYLVTGAAIGFCVSSVASYAER